MKICVIGDIHGRVNWMWLYANYHLFDRIVFLGDILDSKEISAATQLSNFQQLMKFIREHKDICDIVLGNHDLSYIDPTLYQCAGYDMHMMIDASTLFEDNKDLFSMAVEHDGYLFTHAGLSLTWLAKYNKEVTNLPIAEQINMIYKHKSTAFSFYSNQGRYMSSTGNCVTQSPVWIRPASLLLKPAHPFQVVGHTQHVVPIRVQRNGNEIIFADSPDYYTVIDNGDFSFHKFE